MKMIHDHFLIHSKKQFQRFHTTIKYWAGHYTLKCLEFPHALTFSHLKVPI